MKLFERIEYVGEPVLTRGDNGENVRFGRVSPEGEVFVFDSYFGWTSWGQITPDWSRTGKMQSAVKADY